jgi:SAM-dependent methyltransferase
MENGHDPAHKWDAYFAREDPPPWESGSPNSQVVTFLNDVDLVPRRGFVVDFGCGGGLNTIAASSKGFHALGIDISARALELSRQRAMETDSGAKFDLLDLTNPWALNFHYQELSGVADAGVDVQTWHAVRGGKLQNIYSSFHSLIC